MAEGRSFSEMAGGGFGNPGGIVGVRATPNQMPAPNSEPLGAKTGAPPRVRFYSTLVIPFSAIGVRGAEPTQIIPPTPPNRVCILTAPLVSFTIYIGESGVSPATGLALTPGTQLRGAARRAAGAVRRDGRAGVLAAADPDLASAVRGA